MSIERSEIKPQVNSTLTPPPCRLTLLDSNALSWFSVVSTSNGDSLRFGGMLKNGYRSDLKTISGLTAPKSVTTSVDGRMVYVAGFGEGAVSWYTVKSDDGSLAFGGALKNGDSSGGKIVSGVSFEQSKSANSIL